MSLLWQPTPAPTEGEPKRTCSQSSDHKKNDEYQESDSKRGENKSENREVSGGRIGGLEMHTCGSTRLYR